VATACPTCGAVRSAEWSGDDNEARLELRMRQFAIPGALAASFVLVSAAPGLFRTFVSMWTHELGHATAAWFCGFPAFPGPWRTMIAEERSFVFGLLLAAALGYAAFRARVRERKGLAALAATAVLLQFVGSVVLRAPSAQALISFAGDAGCLVLGTALMLTVYSPPDSRFRRGWLRWGLLCLGAISYADAARTWWRARGDADEIPFGEIEGVGLSDPSVLSEVHGWSPSKMISRYLALAVVCLVVLAIAYASGLRNARASSVAYED
jgi:hypothetical protein